MSLNNTGNAPNDGESSPKESADDQNKQQASGDPSGPVEKRAAVPAQPKRERKTDVQRLEEARSKRQAALEKERKLVAKIEKKHNKELLRTKIALGAACLNLVNKSVDPRSRDKTISTLVGAANETDKVWLKGYFDALAKSYAGANPPVQGADGKFPPQS